MRLPTSARPDCTGINLTLPYFVVNGNLPVLNQQKSKPGKRNDRLADLPKLVGNLDYFSTASDTKYGATDCTGNANKVKGCQFTSDRAALA
jgi:hypothetical protein